VQPDKGPRSHPLYSPFPGARLRYLLWRSLGQAVSVEAVQMGEIRLQKSAPKICEDSLIWIEQKSKMQSL
jgi:hypothetical protein